MSYCMTTEWEGRPVVITDSRTARGYWLIDGRWVFMNKFRKLGLTDYNGDIYVHNALLNLVVHDNPAAGDDAED